MDEKKKASIEKKYHALRSGKGKQQQHDEAMSGSYAKKKEMAKKISSEEPKGHGQFEHVNRPMTYAEKWGKKEIK